MSGHLAEHERRQTRRAEARVHAAKQRDEIRPLLLCRLNLACDYLCRVWITVEGDGCSRDEDFVKVTLDADPPKLLAGW